MDSVKDKIHMDEELDERCRFLRIRRRWWIIPLAAAARRPSLFSCVFHRDDRFCARAPL